VTELNGTGGRNHSNVYAAGELLSTYDRSGLHFELSDWQGTKRVQTDPLGQVEESCVSLPFGDGLSCTATALASSDDATEHHFTGKEHDAESGNEYFDARYLSSTLGRFLTPDWAAKPTSVPYASFGDPQTLNLYSYVENGPLNRVDADGHANAKLPIGYESIDDFANPSCGPHYSGGDPCWASNQGLSEAIDEANYLAQVQQASASTGNTAAQPAQAQAQQQAQSSNNSGLVAKPVYEGINLRGLLDQVLGLFGIHLGNVSAGGNTLSENVPVPLPIPSTLTWIELIANGHGWEDHGAKEFNSKTDYQNKILETVQNAQGGDIVRNPNGRKGVTGYWNDSEGFVVWRDKNHPDQGTAFHPEQPDVYKTRWGFE
jgi:RHS repeat-associated protein